MTEGHAPRRQRLVERFPEHLPLCAVPEHESKARYPCDPAPG